MFCIDVRSEGLRRHLEAAGRWTPTRLRRLLRPTRAHRGGRCRTGPGRCPVLMRPVATVGRPPTPRRYAAGGPGGRGAGRSPRPRPTRSARSPSWRSPACSPPWRCAPWRRPVRATRRRHRADGGRPRRRPDPRRAGLLRGGDAAPSG
ncbi:hypothetical protein V2I01_31805 [Micromonospora sp. BRA006-A]|nr:hypothetical protein [Micromonospora sp. BRA006-A]